MHARQQSGKAGGLRRHLRAHRLHERVGPVGIVGAARKPREPDEVEQCGGIAAGHGAVVELFLPRDKRLGVVGREEERAGGVVVKVLDHFVGEAHRLAKPARVEGGLVQLDEAPHEEGVVVEVSADGDVAVPVSVHQAAVIVSHRVEQKRGGANGSLLDLVGRVEDAGRPGHRRDHQPVPVREHLVVESGTRTLPVAGVEKRSAGPLPPLRDEGVGVVAALARRLSDRLL